MSSIKTIDIPTHDFPGATDVLAGVAAAVGVGDFARADALIVRGREQFGVVTTGNGQDVWKAAQYKVDGKRPKVQAAPVQAAPKVDELALPGGPADGGEPIASITIVHNATDGTVTRGGLVQGDGTYDVMGAKGQHWNYRHSYNNGSVRVPGRFGMNRSKGLMPDMDRIGSMTMALRNAGCEVLHEIDTTDCGPLPRPSTAKRARALGCRGAAKSQTRIVPGTGSEQPVSAPPAPVQETVAAPVQDTEAWVAVVEAWGVTAPVSAPPATVAEIVDEPVVDYAAMALPNVIALAFQLEEAAIVELAARAQVNALTHVAALPAPVVEPVQESAPVVEVAPVQESAPVASVGMTDHAVVLPGYVEVWFTMEASFREAKAMAPLARGLVARKGVQVGATTHIAVNKKHHALKVYAELSAGADVAEVLATILATVRGDDDFLRMFGAVRPAVQAEETVSA